MAASNILLLLSCSLLAVLQIHTAYCQDLNRMSLQLERLRSLSNSVDYIQETSQNIEDQILLEVLQKLWTADILELRENRTSNLSRKCTDSAKSILPGLNFNISELSRVLPLLDASGKPGAGMLNGNFILDGAYDECFSYNYTAFCYATEITLTDSTLYPPMIIGLCVPKHCNSRDLSILINETELFQVSEGTVYCEDLKDPPYGSGAVAMIVVTLVFVGLVVIGTVVDVLIQHVPRFFSGDSSTLPVNARDSGDNEKMPLAPKLTIKRKSDSVKLWDFITSFSLFSTIPTLLETSQSSGVITSLNGLRVVSMFWVILCHTYAWILAPGRADNPIVMKDVLSRFSFQVVGNGFFSVDSFFFISGVLVAYLSLRAMERKNGRFPFLHYYIHRYLRLTPVYAFILFFSWALFDHLAHGPGLDAGALAIYDKCSKYWWANLVYINNFYPWRSADGTCIGWGWYLANDMQFYVISPFILIPMYMFFPVALLILGSLLLCSFFVTGSLVGVYNYQANFFISVVDTNYTVDPTGPQYFDLVYSKPWSRIQPYLVGLLLGYILYKKVRFHFSRKGNLVMYLALWIAAGLILFPDVYGLYFTYHGHVPEKIENILYLTLGRFAWGVGLAIIVFTCHNGYGWFINSFLSLKLWTPLARMTYCAYLVHPVVISVVYGQLQKSLHYTDITVALFSVCFVVISYGVAGALCLVLEFPLANIEMLLFKLVGIKGRESQRQNLKGVYVKH